MPGLETTPEMFDLRMSEEARPLLEKVKTFVKNYAYIAAELGKNPLAAEYLNCSAPDEVHWFVVGRAELARWQEDASDYDPKAAFLAGN